MRPKGTKQRLEIRRRVAVALLDAGWGIRQGARQVKASPGSACRWRDRRAQPGEAGLTATRHPGSQANLSPTPCPALLDLLSRGARAQGYRTELGTLRRIAALIARHLGLRDCPSGGWRIVRRLKWSPQKPARRAREREEGASAPWRSHPWSRLKKSPA